MALASLLPPEILQEIFFLVSIDDNAYPSHCYEMGLPPSITGYTGPWQLGHICKYWRDVLINYPLVWRTISVHLNPKDPLLLYRTKEALRRSRLEAGAGPTLSISLGCHTSELTLREELASLPALPIFISANAFYHCVALVLILDRHGASTLIALPEDTFPNLRRLKIDVEGVYAFHLVESLKVFKQSHDLEVIQIVSDHPELIPLPDILPQLSYLEIQYLDTSMRPVKAETLRELLGNASLQTLKISHVKFPPTVSNIIHQKSITRLEVFMADQPTWESLKIPSLTHLAIYNLLPPFLPDMIAFLIRSECILRFFSCDSNPTAPTLMDIFDMLSNVPFAEIRELSIRITGANLEELFHQLGVLLHLHNQSALRPLVVPLLESFEIVLLDRIYEDGQLSRLFPPEVVDAIDSRFHSSRLRKLVLRFGYDLQTGRYDIFSRLGREDELQISEWKRQGLDVRIPGMKS